MCVTEKRGSRCSFKRTLCGRNSRNEVAKKEGGNESKINFGCVRFLTHFCIRSIRYMTAVEFKGCHAIRTNTETDCFKALKTYRERQVIEQGFDQLKNEVGGSRFECTQSSYKGKLFVYCLAQALRMMMLCTVRRAQADTGLKLPRQSLRKALIQLQSVQATKHRATNTFIVKAVAKRHRDLFALLGITKLPKRLDRFS